jgi:flagellar biosynthesis repressor protein FlbT
MALRLSLKPRERVIIGGAVLKNGGSPVHLTVENRVAILRQSDVLSPREAQTPCKRIYLALQLLYLDPENAATHLETYRTLVDQVAEAAPSTRPLIAAVDAQVHAGDHYRALKAARPLIEYEGKLLHHVR